MKSFIIAGIMILVLITIVLLLGFSKVGERIRSEDDWDVSDEYGSIDGSWGTELIVEYMDGSSENLNDPLPTMEVFFRNKKVKDFKYILSSRGSSDTYDSIEMDISGFDVLVTVQDMEGEWGIVSKSDDITILEMDDEWRDIYIVQVDASDLEILEVNKTYNLSFTPSGSIKYHGSSTGRWIDIPLPNWYYIRFIIKSEIVDPYHPPEIGEKWVEVEVKGEKFI